jgi:quercetin dioxygenase-like cupin family protein
MASAELVVDPVMRQRYRLWQEGDVLHNEVSAEPGAGVPEHFHPRIEERFEVLEGEFTFTVDGEERMAGPGDRLVVEAGARHRFENSGRGVGRLVAEIEPALDMREFFEESAALARAGVFARPGLPKPRGLPAAADFALRYRDTTVMTFPPRLLQRLLFPPLARLCRR